MENKIQLFEGVKVRYAWDAENEDWLFSAVDVCNVLAESASKDPGAYRRKLKQRLIKEGSEVVTNCHGLKMTSSRAKRQSKLKSSTVLGDFTAQLQSNASIARNNSAYFMVEKIAEKVRYIEIRIYVI